MVPKSINILQLFSLLLLCQKGFGEGDETTTTSTSTTEATGDKPEDNSTGIFRKYIVSHPFDFFYELDKIDEVLKCDDGCFVQEIEYYEKSAEGGPDVANSPPPIKIRCSNHQGECDKSEIKSRGYEEEVSNHVRKVSSCYPGPGIGIYTSFKNHKVAILCKRPREYLLVNRVFCGDSFAGHYRLAVCGIFKATTRFSPKGNHFTYIPFCCPVNESPMCIPSIEKLEIAKCTDTALQFCYFDMQVGTVLDPSMTLEAENIFSKTFRANIGLRFKIPTNDITVEDIGHNYKDMTYEGKVIDFNYHMKDIWGPVKKITKHYKMVTSEKSVVYQYIGKCGPFITYSRSFVFGEAE